MARIKHYDKRVGITYVYESESYYDKEKHQSRSRRTLIGKINPETGEVVPTGKRGRPPKNIISPEENSIDYKELFETTQKELLEKNKIIADLRRQLADSSAVVKRQATVIRKIVQLCEGI